MSLFLVSDYHKIEADWKPGIYMQGKSIQRFRATDSATVLYLSGVKCAGMKFWQVWFRG